MKVELVAIRISNGCGIDDFELSWPKVNLPNGPFHLSPVPLDFPQSGSYVSNVKVECEGLANLERSTFVTAVQSESEGPGLKFSISWMFPSSIYSGKLQAEAFLIEL